MLRGPLRYPFPVDVDVGVARYCLWPDVEERARAEKRKRAAESAEKNEKRARNTKNLHHLLPFLRLHSFVSASHNVETAFTVCDGYRFARVYNSIRIPSLSEFSRDGDF